MRSGSARPIQAAGSGELESDRELAQSDGANASIGVNDDMGGNGIRKTELVCCRHAEWLEYRDRQW